MQGADTVEGIANELVGAGLVDGKDMLVIAGSLSKLLHTNQDQLSIKHVTFPLVSHTAHE